MESPANRSLAAASIGSAHSESEISEGSRTFMASYWRPLLIGIVILAGVLRVAPIMRRGLDWAIWYDSMQYIELSQGLRSGCGFAGLIGGHCLSPEIVRTPGYPVFLTLFPSLRGALVVQALLSTLACLFLALTLRSRFSRSTAIIAALLLALDVPSIHAGTQILADSLCQSLVAFTVFAELWALEARTTRSTILRLGLSTFLLSSAVLVRPNAIVLIFLAPLPVFLFTGGRWYRRLLSAIIFASLPIATVLSWTARNRAETGVNTFAAIAGYNFYYFRAADVLVWHDRISFAAAQNKLQNELGARSNSPWVIDAKQYDQMWRRGREIVFAHPLIYGLESVEDLAIIMTLPERRPLAAPVRGYAPGPARIRDAMSAIFTSPIKTFESIYHDEFYSSQIYLLMFLFQLFLTAFQILGVALAFGVCRAYRRSARAQIILYVIFPLLIAFALLVSAAGAEGAARLRLGAIPFLAMVAAVGWDRRIGATRGTTSLRNTVPAEWRLRRD